MFLDFKGASSLRTLIVSSVSGLSAVWCKVCALAQHRYQVLAVVEIRTKSPETLETNRVEGQGHPQRPEALESISV